MRGHCGQTSKRKQNILQAREGGQKLKRWQELKTFGMDLRGDMEVCHLGKWGRGSNQSEQNCWFLLISKASGRMQG